MVKYRQMIGMHFPLFPLLITAHVYDDILFKETPPVGCLHKRKILICVKESSSLLLAIWLWHQSVFGAYALCKAHAVDRNHIDSDWCYVGALAQWNRIFRHLECSPANIAKLNVQEASHGQGESSLYDVSLPWHSTPNGKGAPTQYRPTDSSSGAPEARYSCANLSWTCQADAGVGNLEKHKSHFCFNKMFLEP